MKGVLHRNRFVSRHMYYYVATQRPWYMQEINKLSYWLLAGYVVPVFERLVEDNFLFFPVLVRAGEIHWFTADTAGNPEIILVLAHKFHTLLPALLIDCFACCVHLLHEPAFTKLFCLTVSGFLKRFAVWIYQRWSFQGGYILV